MGSIYRADAAAAPTCQRGLLSGVLRIAVAVGVGLTVANCSSQKSAQRSSVDPKYGVAPSPRVVGENDPVPKGGGRVMVGKPYVVGGRTYVPRENPNYAAEGLASWYGTTFHGRLTANGEIFDRHSIAAAHPTMPLPSYARVTNLRNNRSMIVRVNDRGPYHGNRVLDVSQRVAEALEFKHAGTARVRVEYVGRASVHGSDDRILMASLRTDGVPASLQGRSPTMVAEAPAQSRQALAFRETPQPVEEEAPAARIALSGRPIAGQTATLALAEASRAVAVEPAPALANVPLPPERPFDLGTIPHAATPVASVPVPVPTASLMPPQRPVTAGLFYAAPEAASSRFSKDDPFNNLRPQRFVSLQAPR